MRLTKITDKDMGKYEVVQQVINSNLSTKVACDKLKLSDRQLRRLKVRVKDSGISGVIHGNRDRISNRRIDPVKEEDIVKPKKKNNLDLGLLQLMRN